MMAAHILSWMKKDGVGGRVYSPTDVIRLVSKYGPYSTMSATFVPVTGQLSAHPAG